MSNETQLKGTPAFNQLLLDCHHSPSLPLLPLPHHNCTPQLQNISDVKDDCQVVSKIKNIQISSRTDSDSSDYDAVFEQRLDSEFSDKCVDLNEIFVQKLKRFSHLDNHNEDYKNKTSLRRNSICLDDDSSKVVIDSFLCKETKHLSLSKTELSKDQSKIRPKSLRLTNCFEDQMNEEKVPKKSSQRQQRATPSPSTTSSPSLSAQYKTHQTNQRAQLQQQETVEEQSEQDINAILEEGFRLLSWFNAVTTQITNSKHLLIHASPVNDFARKFL
ncbi:hypothetical protein HELRODRAFT_162631 [Helobdella robusta]|uniref:Uncharacterized protein n=1 Tax=Helobdella robusta TaxID=6412 RepID=T1ESY1_HELRO|nr:hypothetical protein HELRODRAFT_162631 [Helobdella robusta]ESN99136.1 hypothetical protein HELRODRAFT_162631 [Helobdella robusta]